MVEFKQIQDKWQKKWLDAKVFEANPDARKKYFINIPYPYISGSLHIGHARVVTEADVFSRYLRMSGYNVLYPLAFHISGTPVLGISAAIKNKDAKKIDLYKSYVKNYVSNTKEVDKIVASFEDPWEIVNFFTPKMMAEFSGLGLGVDWRRRFTSGDIEHQKMVEWQFRKYKQNNYLVQGNYPLLYCVNCQNAVGEDDITEGDTNPVEKSEFTILKFKYEGMYIVAATLRPETMFGQTNMWVNPDVEYEIASVDNEKWIASKEFFEKMKYQKKNPKKIGVIMGSELIGKVCKAPIIDRDIIILPSEFPDSDIATGFVTSVPSDAPYDYIALKELQNDVKLHAKYRLSKELIDVIKKIELIPIIKSKGFGDFPAAEICKKIGIKSLADVDKLDNATQEIYKLGFHTGIMNQNSGKYSGMKVIDAKEVMKKDLIAKKQADIFFETSRKALCRCSGKVVVAVMENQWFLDFNSSGWKQKAQKCLDKMEIVPDKYRKQFEDVFAWLDKRPCARKRGLGTRLPFDNQWVIESLSDSVIYMSLYTINHKIKEFGIKGEQLTEEFFNYVYRGEGNVKDVSVVTKIPVVQLDEMRKEFDYWYPFDHRHTFTAHLSNHLSFMIFAHTACFDVAKWPRKITFHGMVISEGSKMSKSKGNVVSLLDINNKYGADAFRAFMCNSTSVESTFNWQTNECLNLKNHVENIYEIIKNMEFSDDKVSDAFMSKFERNVKEATDAIAKMDLRGYSNIVLYKIYNDYKKEMKFGSVKAVNKYIYEKWIKLLAPLIPHYAEELWSLNHKDFVSVSAWPKADESKIDPVAEFEQEFSEKCVADIKNVLAFAKVAKPKNIKLIISASWKYKFYSILKELIVNTRDVGSLIKSVLDTDLKCYSNEITKIIPAVLKDSSKMPLIVLDQGTEMKTIDLVKESIEKEFNCKVSVIVEEESADLKAKNAMPGKPAIVVE